MILFSKNHSFCPLCCSISIKIKNDNYFKCKKCGGVFLDKIKYLSSEDEKKRYEFHNNDVFNLGYRNFVSPITEAILAEQSKESIGLDFGSGTGSVVSVVLKENNYNISEYDPFFANNKTLLETKYDYIACSEVVEHFKNPRIEFFLLKTLLKPGGKIYIMTDFYKENIDFKSWYYRKDPTHVFIYTPTTFEYIKKKFKFSNLEISGRLVVINN